MTRTLSGPQKAAILVSMIDEEAAAAVVQSLDEDEIRALVAEIARVDVVDPDECDDALAEFEEMIESARGLFRVGAAKARRLVQRLDSSLGEKMSEEVLGDVDDTSSPNLSGEGGLPTELARAPSRRLAVLLRAESPQTTALVLSRLHPRKAARVLAALGPRVRADVTRRLAGLHEVRPEVVARIGRALVERLPEIDEEPVVAVDGRAVAVATLRSLGRSAGQEIVGELEDDEPELARALRDELFTFEMLRCLPDRDVPEILKQVDRSTLALALKGADEELCSMFLGAMSERAGQMLREEMDFFLAPRLAEIEQAQRVIIEVALRLENEGTIVIEDEAPLRSVVGAEAT